MDAAFAPPTGTVSRGVPAAPRPDYRSIGPSPPSIHKPVPFNKSALLDALASSERRTRSATASRASPASVAMRAHGTVAGDPIIEHPSSPGTPRQLQLGHVEELPWTDTFRPKQPTSLTESPASLHGSFRVLHLAQRVKMDDAASASAFSDLSDSVGFVVDRLTQSGKSLNEAFHLLARHTRAYFADEDCSAALSSYEVALSDSVVSARQGGTELGAEAVAVAGLGDWLAAYCNGAPIKARNAARQAFQTILSAVFAPTGAEELHREVDSWSSAAFRTTTQHSSTRPESLFKVFRRWHAPDAWRSVAREENTERSQLHHRLNTIETVHRRELVAADAVARFWEKYSKQRLFKAWRGVVVESAQAAERARQKLLADRAVEVLKNKITEREQRVDELDRKLEAFDRVAEMARQRILGDWEKDKQNLSSAKAQIVELQFQVNKLDEDRLTARSKCVFLENELNRALADLRRLARLDNASPASDDTSLPQSPSVADDHRRPSHGYMDAPTATLTAAMELFDELCDALEEGIEANDDLMAKAFDLNDKLVSSGNTGSVHATVPLLTDADKVSLREKGPRQRFPMLLCNTALSSCSYHASEEAMTSLLTPTRDKPLMPPQVIDLVLDEGLPELTRVHPRLFDGAPPEPEGSTALRSINALFDMRVTALLKSPFLLPRVEPRHVAKLRERVRESCRKLAFVMITRSRASEALLHESLQRAYALKHFYGSSSALLARSDSMINP